MRYIRTSSLARLVVALVTISLGIGIFIGYALTRNVWEQSAIDQGFAHYSEYDRSFLWRMDLRPPLTNERGWCVCPMCGGTGEIYVGDPSLKDAPPEEGVNPIQEM